MTTSSDGYLTVTADGLSVLVELDFSADVPAPTINLLANPSSEVTASLVAGASSAVARSATQHRSGGYSARLTRSSGSGTVVATTPTGLDGAPVAAGQSYTASAYVRAGSTGRTVTVGLAWYTAEGDPTGSVATGSGVATDATWTARPTVTATAPAGAAYAALVVTVAAVGSTTEYQYVDDLMIEPGAAVTVYCAGDQLGCRWTGAGDASLSVRPAYDRVTVRRDGIAVRGLDGARIPGGVGRGVDHEAPLGVALAYTATLINGIGEIVSTAATAELADSDGVVLKSLRRPDLSGAWRGREMPEWTRPIQQAILPVLGGRYPVVTPDRRRAVSGTLALILDTDEEEARLLALVDAEGPYLLQLPASYREPDRYVMVGDVGVARLNRWGSDPWRIISLPLVQVARPSTAGSRVSIPGHTYADSLAAHPAYGDRTGTYLDA